MSDDAEKVALRKLTGTLQGPVLEIMCQLVPEVARLPKLSAIQTIIDDIDLLNKCLQVFKNNPNHFKHLLIDEHNVPVKDAESLLDCGRSLDDVVAMVVRTAAKRHFRYHLDGVRTPLRLHGQGLVGQKGLLFRIRNMLSANIKPSVAPQRPRSQGEILYAAFKDYLRYDWQVPLIPDYCQLPVQTVEKLGSHLADQEKAETLVNAGFDPEKFLRDVAAINAASPLPVPDVKLTQAINHDRAAKAKRVTGGMAQFMEEVTPDSHDLRAKLPEILTADGNSIEPNIFGKTLLDPDVRNALPDEVARLKISSFLAGIGAQGVRILVAELGLRQDQLAVFLVNSRLAMGEKMFDAAFGIPGRADYVDKLVQRAKASQITQQSTLTQVANFVTKSLKKQKA